MLSGKTAIRCFSLPAASLRQVHQELLSRDISISSEVFAPEPLVHTAFQRCIHAADAFHFSFSFYLLRHEALQASPSSIDALRAVIKRKRRRTDENARKRTNRRTERNHAPPRPPPKTPPNTAVAHRRTKSYIKHTRYCIIGGFYISGTGAWRRYQQLPGKPPKDRVRVSEVLMGILKIDSI